MYVKYYTGPRRRSRQQLHGLEGLGSKLKKVLKKVEQVARPLAKVAAIGAVATFAPTMLPMAAPLLLAKKPSEAPVDPGVPMVPPPAIQTAVPFQAPTFQQQAPQSFMPQQAPQYMPVPPSDGGGGIDKQLLVYGGLALGSVLLVTMLSNRR